MAWNEPGGGNRDPWSGSGRDQGPPDLDELMKKVQDRLRRLFGRSGRPGGGGGGGGAGTIGVGLIAVILLAVWLLSGFYTVKEGNRGVVLRFGEYSAIAMPGWGWHWPYPIESVRTVNVEDRRVVRIGYVEGPPGSRPQAIPSEGLMLTQDENIVNVQLVVQWQVSDPAQYLFTLLEPEQTLKQLTESALREVVGKRTMDFVLTQGRAEVEDATNSLIQSALERYKAGIQVVEVAVQDIQPPEEVQDAFADAIRARENEQHSINEAKTYSSDELPKAAGAADKLIQEAEAYKAKVVFDAQGEATRFLTLLPEYKRAPEVTRERLYLEAVESMLAKSSKALISVEGGQPLMYLPLDKMLQRGPDGKSGDSGATAAGAPAGTGAGGPSAGAAEPRDRLRSREVR